MKNRSLYCLSVALLAVVLAVESHSQTTGRKSYEQFENLLARMGLQYDCYFTIEKARPTDLEAYSLSTFQSDNENNFQPGNSLMSDLERIAKRMPHVSFRFDPNNSKIIHAMDDRLSQIRDYALDKKLSHFAFKGRLWELPDSIGKEGPRIERKRTGDTRDLLVMDFRTVIDYQANELTVRSILTESANLEERGRILWIAESDLKSEQRTYVWFIMSGRS